MDGVIAARTAFNPPREGDGGGPWGMVRCLVSVRGRVQIRARIL